MSDLYAEIGMVVVSYVVGFVVGVWATRSWVEQVAPGTSRHLLELDDRQQRNKK